MDASEESEEDPGLLNGCRGRCVSLEVAGQVHVAKYAETRHADDQEDCQNDAFHILISPPFSGSRVNTPLATKCG